MSAGIVEDIDYSLLDPGIRGTVKWLRSVGFITTDSGDGSSKYKEIDEGEALDVAHVHMTLDPDGSRGQAIWLLTLLEAKGLTVPPGMIQLTFDPADGSCCLSLYGVDDKTVPATSEESKQ